MDIDKVFQDQLIKITQEAAISVFPHLGKNNKIIADEAATNSCLLYTSPSPRDP